MFSSIPVHNERRQVMVGLVVFAFAFWITYYMFGKLGAELERVCQIVEAAGDRCKTGADPSILYWIAVVGCVALGYLGFRLSNFMFQGRK